MLVKGGVGVRDGVRVGVREATGVGVRLLEFEIPGVEVRVGPVIGINIVGCVAVVKEGSVAEAV